MKKIFLLTAILCAMLLVLGSCNDPQTITDSEPALSDSPEPDVTRIEGEAAHFAGMYGLTGAEYTNRNGHVETCAVGWPTFTDCEILERSEDGLEYTCTAQLTSEDWIGSTKFKITYLLNQGVYTVNSLDFEKTEISPAHPLDFSDENKEPLFYKDKFRYKITPEDRLTTSVTVNADTLESVRLIEFLQINEKTEESSPDDEHYKIEITLNSGEIMQGTIFCYYRPALISEHDFEDFNRFKEIEDVEKWRILTHDDFMLIR
ncbi:MAG TPA: hypothetical protein DEQ02_02455 [Ruminococcaceae bacterium]|nr:hypothetical protein [Oscillospiraceae bacterium]